MPARPQTIETVKAHFGELPISEFRGQTRVKVAQVAQYELLEYLKDECGFDFLSDITAVDLLNIRDAVDRFQLVYQLVSYETNERLTVLVMLNEPKLSVHSAVPLWEGADWLEREVYDMFGITFEGHPDLRRILMPDEFTAFPLRKDYPMQGRGERHNFQRVERAQG